MPQHLALVLWEKRHSCHGILETKRHPNCDFLHKVWRDLKQIHCNDTQDIPEFIIRYSKKEVKKK